MFDWCQSYRSHVILNIEPDKLFKYLSSLYLHGDWAGAVEWIGNGSL